MHRRRFRVAKTVSAIHHSGARGCEAVVPLYAAASSSANNAETGGAAARHARSKAPRQMRSISRSTSPITGAIVAPAFPDRWLVSRRKCTSAWTSAKRPRWAHACPVPRRWLQSRKDLRRRNRHAGIDQQHAALGSRGNASGRARRCPSIHAVSQSTQTGTSAPSDAAISMQRVVDRVSRSHRCTSPRSTAAASADPPPRPEATGRFFVRQCARRGARAAVLSASAFRRPAARDCPRRQQAARRKGRSATAKIRRRGIEARSHRRMP